ncbi:MAG: endonuclease domain-containing protein, partial [Acetobacteraceae bacterium]
VLRLQTTRARTLRRNGTEVEQRLWRALRQAGFPWRFRRQHPIGGWIVDLACPARRLVIELDGGQHGPQCAADAVRSAGIEAHGYRVIRFWNNEVMENLDGVLQSIRAALENFPA